MAFINSISVFDLGRIKTWESDKASNLIPTPFPGQDAGLAEAPDTLGTILYYKITGTVTGTFRSLQDFELGVNSIQDGKQISDIALAAPFVSTREVLTVNSDDMPISYIPRKGTMGTITNVAGNTVTDSSVSNFIDFHGIRTGNVIMNLHTGATSFISGVSGNVLTLQSQIFTEAGQSYALNSAVSVKILSFKMTRVLPGLTFAHYDLSCLQTRPIGVTVI